MGGVDEQTCMEIPTNLYIVYIHIMPTKNLLTLQTLLAGNKVYASVNGFSGSLGNKPRD